MIKLHQIKWSRSMIEAITVAVVIILGAMVFLVSVKQQATLTYDNGQIVYTGDVVNHRMNGKGKLVFANGDTYEGDFKNGTFNGKGLFVASTGWSYEGDFKNGKPDGQGKLIAKDKKVFEGKFKQGIYQK